MALSQAGFKGISFPFRIDGRGGVVMSTTSMQEVPHIIEAMQQILLTRPNERCMEYHVKSDIDTDIFEPNDSSCHTLLAYQVKEALRELEDRVEIVDVTISSRNSEVYATILFNVLKYNTTYSEEVKVGEINVQNSN